MSFCQFKPLIPLKLMPNLYYINFINSPNLNHGNLRLATIQVSQLDANSVCKDSIYFFGSRRTFPYLLKMIFLLSQILYVPELLERLPL